MAESPRCVRQREKWFMQTCDVVDVGSLKLDSAHCPRRSVRKCEANVRPCKLKCRALLALADFSGGVRVFSFTWLAEKIANGW